MKAKAGFIILGGMLFVSGLFKVITGEDSIIWEVHVVPAWISWVFIPTGIACILFAIIGDNKKHITETPSDAEIARIKAELDQMHALTEEERAEMSRIIGTPPNEHAEHSNGHADPQNTPAENINKQ